MRVSIDRLGAVGPLRAGKCLSRDQRKRWIHGFFIWLLVPRAVSGVSEPLASARSLSPSRYRWLTSPASTRRLKSADLLRGTVTDFHFSPARCLARNMIWPQ